MMDDDFDEEMMISDMPTVHNKTINNSDVTINDNARTLNTMSEMGEKSVYPNSEGHSCTESSAKKKRTLYNPNQSETDFGRRSPQPSTSRVGGWLNKSTHLVGPDDETQESHSPVVPNQSMVKELFYCNVHCLIILDF